MASQHAGKELAEVVREYIKHFELYKLASHESPELSRFLSPRAARMFRNSRLLLHIDFVEASQAGIEFVAGRPAGWNAWKDRSTVASQLVKLISSSPVPMLATDFEIAWEIFVDGFPKFADDKLVKDLWPFLLALANASSWLETDPVSETK
jgi:hypothetical protein